MKANLNSVRIKCFEKSTWIVTAQNSTVKLGQILLSSGEQAFTTIVTESLSQGETQIPVLGDWILENDLILPE